MKKYFALLIIFILGMNFVLTCGENEGGFPWSYDPILYDPLENARLNQQANELENELNETSSQNSTVSAPSVSSNSADYAQEEFDDLDTDLENAQEQAVIDTEQNLEDSQDMQDTINSDTSGDPVKLTRGSYEQNETDLIVGNLFPIQINRNYSSQSKIVSSYGYGWSTNLDQRIILGVKADQDKIEEAYEERVNTLKSLISSLSSHIISAYTVSSAETARSEFGSKVDNCRGNYNRAASIESSLSSLESAAQGYPCQSRITGLKQSAGSLKKSIYSKVSQFDSAASLLDRELKLIETFKQKLVEAQADLDQFRIDNAPTVARKQRNQAAIFEGMDLWYEETGYNTITVIDENAYPHILYETSEGSGIWQNSTEPMYVQCTQISQGLKLLETDGTEKIFDQAGFLIEVRDRNGNAIFINRSADEKITNVKTSKGETLSFTYNGNQISAIVNLRDARQKVNYFYNGKSLAAVRDSDGDTVSFEYNDHGYLVKLKKPDESAITFFYDQVTSDGRYLATQTRDEEGHPEYFDYDLNLRRTIYTDHDENQTVYWYDDANRTVRQIDPDGTTTENEYNSDGTLRKTSVNGNETIFKYDSRGNKTYARYSDSSYETFGYNNYNQLCFYKDRDGIEYQYVHDDKGNLVEYWCGSSRVFSQKLDSEGNIKKRIVYGGQPVITEYEYDSFGNLTCEKTAGVATTYIYDFQNRVLEKWRDGILVSSWNYGAGQTTQTDHNGLETTWVSNSRKDIVLVVQKDTITGIEHKKRIEYDKRHLPVKMYDDQKLICEYEYTSEGKIKSQTIGQNFFEEYFYANGTLSLIKQRTNKNDSDFFTYSYTSQNKSNNEKLLTITDGLGHSTVYEYDPWGRLKNQTKANGEAAGNLWSSAGRLKKSQSEYGGYYEYIYDTSGLVEKSGRENSDGTIAAYNPDGTIKAQTDVLGNTTWFSYDNAGRCVRVQNVSGSVWYEYDNFDRITKQITGNSPDENEAVFYATYEYSEDWRTILSTQGGKYKTISELDAFGNIVKQTDGNRNSKRYEYDNQNRLTAAYDGYDNKTTYEYYTTGLLKCTVFPDGAKSQYEYNAQGKLTKITDDCGTVYSAQYDKAGRLIKEKNRAESEKSYEYDNGSRLTKIICGGQVVESYVYQNNGKTLTVKDGNNSNYFYSYNSYGELVNEKNRLGLMQHFYYDSTGELSSQNNFDSSITTIEWSGDRLSQTVHYSDGSENHFEYDAAGNIILTQNDHSKTEYKYDKGGRLILQKELTTGEEIRYEYDNAGNRIRLYSSNRETSWTYGANNEVKNIFDNKQLVRVQLDYDINGKEILRKFGNGTSEHTQYDKAGRITLKVQKDSNGNILWGEGYVYAPDGKRTATVDHNARVTLYEYDNQGRLSAAYYPYTQEHEQLLRNEAELNGLASSGDVAENHFLSAAQRTAISSLLNELHYTLASSLSTMQIFIKESYTYDKNGNRIFKQTKLGKIEYSYDSENRLVSTGSHGQAFVRYTYDNQGNLLSEESALKSTTYAYNSQNRIICCQVIDKKAQTFTQTKYAYDAFGRRILVQDFDNPALRTVYDGFTFDVIKQAQTFENGAFTNTGTSGISWNSTGLPTGERYRYLEDQVASDGNRYFYLDQGTYKAATTRYQGERTHFSLNGTVAAQASSTAGPEYFTTDSHNSIRTTTNVVGSTRSTNTFDAFGTLVQGTLADTTDYGYQGKQLDPTALLYNYGYRDYNPTSARFTTTDPIRDGQNWFSYCNGDPINFLDLFGLCARDLSSYTTGGFGELDPSRTEDAYAYIKNAVELNDLMGKQYSTDANAVYVCTTFVSEALEKAGYDPEEYLPGGQRVVDSVTILGDELITPEEGKNPSAGTYVFYHVDDDNKKGHTGIINFDKQGNATILHNGSDGKGKGPEHEYVNERTRPSSKGSFDTWFSETNNSVQYKQIGG